MLIMETCYVKDEFSVGIIFDKAPEGKAMVEVLKAGLASGKFRKNSKAFKIATDIIRDLPVY